LKARSPDILLPMMSLRRTALETAGMLLGLLPISVRNASTPIEATPPRSCGTIGVGAGIGALHEMGAAVDAFALMNKTKSSHAAMLRACPAVTRRHTGKFVFAGLGTALLCLQSTNIAFQQSNEAVDAGGSS